MPIDNSQTTEDTDCSTPGGHRYDADGRCQWCDAESDPTDLSASGADIEIIEMSESREQAAKLIAAGRGVSFWEAMLIVQEWLADCDADIERKDASR